MNDSLMQMLERLVLAQESTAHSMSQVAERLDLLIQAMGEDVCTAYDNWRMAQESIQVHGIVVTGATGGPMKNPALTAANETMRQMVTFGSMLGLDPASRTRLIGGNKEKETNEFAKLLSS